MATSPVGRHDFTIRQGGTLALTITYKSGPSPGTPVDISGYTARMQIRATLVSTTVLLELTTENSRIVLTDPTNGVLQLQVTAADTAALDFDRAVYDLELISGAGAVTPILEGIVYLSKEVTR